MPEPRFAVVTDSTSDLPAGLAAERGLTVVPLSLTIDGTTYEDLVLTQAEFFERMNAAPKLPTTSQPPVGVFVETYERLLRTFDAVISVHISEKLSGTIESARTAAQEFAGKVHVHDSRNLSMGLGMQAIEAARCAAAGSSVEETLAVLESVRERIRMIVGLDKLDNLAKGGRIGAVGAFLGSILDLKVTFTVDAEGKFEPLKRIRGEKAALKYTLDWIDTVMGSATEAAFSVAHAMSLDRAIELRDELMRRYEVTEIFMSETGSVISTHTGTGWGVTVLPVKR